MLFLLHRYFHNNIFHLTFFTNNKIINTKNERETWRRVPDFSTVRLRATMIKLWNYSYAVTCLEVPIDTEEYSEWSSSGGRSHLENSIPKLRAAVNSK
jgi:hypothetical protein